MNSENQVTQSSRRGMALTLLSVACVIVISVAGFVYKMTAPRVMSLKELVNNGAVMYEEPKPILPFELVTQTQQAFTPENIQGEWTLLFFGFTHCPDFCPTTLATLRTLVNQLDVDLQKKLQVVMVSVDPARDTPERIKQYFDGFQFNDEYTDFIGVTGEFVTIKIMADRFYIPFQKKMLDNDLEGKVEAAGGMGPDGGMNDSGMDHSQHMGMQSSSENNYTIVHGENIILINPKGQYHGYFKTPFTVARLKATLRSIVSVYDNES